MFASSEEGKKYRIDAKCRCGFRNQKKNQETSSQEASTVPFHWIAKTASNKCQIISGVRTRRRGPGWAPITARNEAWFWRAATARWGSLPLRPELPTRFQVEFVDALKAQCGRSVKKMEELESYTDKEKNRLLF